MIIVDQYLLFRHSTEKFFKIIINCPMGGGIIVTRDVPLVATLAALSKLYVCS